MHKGKIFSIILTILGVIMLFISVLVGNIFLIYLSIFLFALAYFESFNYNVMVRTASICIISIFIAFIFGFILFVLTH